MLDLLKLLYLLNSLIEKTDKIYKKNEKYKNYLTIILLKLKIFYLL